MQHKEMELFLLCALIMSVTVTANVTVFRVGVILIKGNGSPYDLKRSGAAVTLAFDKVNEDVLNGSYRIEPVMRSYGPKCDANNAPGIASELFHNEGVVAFIGPGCSAALDPVGRMAGYWNVPIITGVGDSGIFMDKTDFPTLTRVSYCQCRLYKVFRSIFLEFGWNITTLIMDRDDEQGLVLGETLDMGLEKWGYYPHVIKYNGKGSPNLKQILRDASSNSRVIILSVSGDSVRRFMLAGLDLGYINGEYIFMDVEMFPFHGNYWGDHGWRRGDSDDGRANVAYDALLRVSLYESKSQLFEEFAMNVKRRANVEYGFDFDSESEEINFFVGAFHDAVLLYGVALNETLETGGYPKDGLTVTHAMWGRHFLGVTDDIFIDDNGDRNTSFTILDLNMNNGQFEPIAFFWGNNPGYTPVTGKSIHWPGGATSAPPDEPFCGFMHEKAQCIDKEPLSVTAIVLLVVLCFTICASLMGILGYRKYTNEAEVRDVSWIVKAEDLHRPSQKRRKISIMAISNPNVVEEEQVFANVAVLMGATVAVRHLHNPLIQLNRKLMQEVRTRRTLLHDNIVRFIGCVLEQPNQCVLHAYCAKGSLQDILANDNIRLDSVFKMSLIDDVVKGMNFIHSSAVHSHGRLRSSNCVIDSLFVLKITDFGLPTLYGSDDLHDDTTVYNRKLLWRAPEHLRHSMPRSGSQPGDVYSLGIVLGEIVTREAPYEAELGYMEVEQIIDDIKAGDNPPCRPKLAVSACKLDLRHLLDGCLDENPTQRPDVATIRKECTKLGIGRHTNILDNLLNRMEQYANNLETLIGERTQLLLQEQKKTEQLLLQILPSPIAEQLKHGQSVEPETYECVTIYFSDIVGFTELSYQCTPLEVVSMLNDLYTCFDSIIEGFDVYKVETIGDAYMVVSGLPVRNGSQHAREIARMSLKLLDSLSRFKVRHSPETTLRLRCGIHSGSCVAGVVGQKMPRYCLFGDTVNTASRMETLGEPLKIHVSPTTQIILAEYNIFVVKERGTIEVKGKGPMVTYWLVGEK